MIMKVYFRNWVYQRKTLLYHLQQLTKMFKPDFKIIKKRIEDLIARDYLERDKDNPNVFKYMA